HLGTQMLTTDGKTQDVNNVDYTKPLTIGPADFGFNQSFILPGSLDMFPYAFVRNNHWVGKVQSQKGWSAFNRVGPAADDFQDTKVLDTFSSEAERFIAESTADANADKPFFLYFALTSPHTPISPSEPFRGKSKLGIYGDFVMETDHCVGRVLAALKKHQVADNTLVVATSDHGPAAYAGRIAEATFGQLKKLEKDGHYSAGPYRGYKFSIYEGGLRVPMVARWPGTIPSATTCDQLVGLPDMMATFADAAAIELTDDQAPDSVSLLPLMRDPVHDGVRDTMLMEGTRGRVIRSGRYKLALCPGSGSDGRFGNTPRSVEAWRAALQKYAKTPTSHAELAQAPFVQLFDLDQDPHEDNNIAAEHPELVTELYETFLSQIAQGRSTDGPKLPQRANVKAFMSVPALIWKGTADADAAIQCTETSDEIIAKYGDKTVLRYKKSIQIAPLGISSVYDRSGYIHPVVTPGGIEVTGDFAADHPHQHALFNAWTNTTFDGRFVDFWNQKAQLGRVSHLEVVAVDRDQFTIKLLHEALTGTDGPESVLEESWTVQIRSMVDKAFVFDILSKQTCVAKSPLTINEYHYGGMGIRGNNQWFSQEGTDALKAYEKQRNRDASTPFPPLDVTRHRFVTREGKRRFDGNHSRAQWVDLSGLVDGKMAGIAVMAHPTNFRYPQPVRLHPSKPYFCYAPMVLGEFKIQPGETYISRFRYVVHDGDLPRKTIEAAWQDFKQR
ncbi:MAG: sulfatase-like hydrolase/transferase, partial [Pirellulaceae bacterium]|nr:sulfatase-like hydrolase/transferase [Pirellulaceae bacterium]